MTSNLKWEDYFLGNENKGFVVLLDRLRKGRKSLKDVKAFFQEWSKATEYYGKEMTYLSKMKPSRHDKGSLIKAFDILKGVGHDLARINETLSEQILNDVNVMIDGFLREQKEILKHHEHEMEAVTKTLNQSAAAIETKESRYIKKCKKLQQAINIVNKGQTGKMTKTEFQAMQDNAVLRKKKMDKAETEFKEAIKYYNQCQDNWEAQLKLTASAFQDLETKRLDLTKKVMLQVITLQEHALVEHTTQVFKSLKQKVGDYIDIQYDIDSYASELSTGTNPSKRQEFSSYFDTGANEYDTTMLETLKSKLRRLSQQKNLQPLPPMPMLSTTSQQSRPAESTIRTSTTNQSFPNTTTLVNEEDVVVSSISTAAPLEVIQENPVPPVPPVPASPGVQSKEVTVKEKKTLTISPASTKVEEEKHSETPLSPDSAIAQTPISPNITKNITTLQQSETSTEGKPNESNQEIEEIQNAFIGKDAIIEFNIPAPPTENEDSPIVDNAHIEEIQGEQIAQSKSIENTLEQEESTTPVSTPSIRRKSILIQEQATAEVPVETANTEQARQPEPQKVEIAPRSSKLEFAATGKQGSIERLRISLTRKSIKIQGHLELYNTADEVWDNAWALIEGKFIWVFNSEEDANKPKGTVKQRAMVGLQTLHINQGVSEDLIKQSDGTQSWNLSVIGQRPQELTMALVNKTSGKLSQIIVHPNADQYQRWQEAIEEVVKTLEKEDE